jgi:transcriptional regulator
MYMHPAFQTDRSASLAFAAARGFGLVIASDGRRPFASPLPFCLDYAEDGTPQVAFHVARGNALAAAVAEGGPWLLAVTGADTYVSPDWYASPDQVPTWLYQAVHLSGPVRTLSDDELRPHLDTLSDTFEERLAPKPVWKVAKVTPGRLKMLKKAIVGIEMRVEHVEGSFKLNQHKSDADHIAVALTLRRQSSEAARTIADRMVAMRPQLDYEPADTAA